MIPWIRLIVIVLSRRFSLRSFQLETAERNRRISEHETDVKIQTETMQMLTKYGYYDSKGPKLQTLDIKNEKQSNKDQNSESESEENGT